MSTNIIVIDKAFISKWPELKEYIDERKGIVCLAYQLNQEIEAVALVSPGRIYHIHTRPESRGMGHGKTLLESIQINYTSPTGDIRASVASDELVAMKLFVGAGFEFIGFDVTNNCNKCLLSYGHSSKNSRIDVMGVVKTEFEEMANRLYVIEASPFRLPTK